MTPRGGLPRTGVFQRIGQGRTPPEMGADMGISLKTVDVHRAHLKAKLDLAHMSDLVRHAVQWVGGQHLK